ncbi:VanZ family protein [Streptomyces katrae]|uniref:VanZ family protein n=1 Tax=Streptomyces katrae TaxID=68223 RepID=UPI000AEFB6E7|nr:VanZ family protein [Streptomyces katrae]
MSTALPSDVMSSGVVSPDAASAGAMSTAQHAAVAAVLVLVLGAVGLALRRPLLRRTGASPTAVLGLLLTAAVLAGITLPDQVVPGVGARLAACLDGASVRTLGGGLAHHAANVVLWTALGVFGTLAVRRPGRVVLAVSVVWAAVELAQTLDPVRSCQYVDWAENTLGAALGALAAWAVARRRATVGGPASSPDEAR